jgi:hypothetical protein
MTFEEFFAKKRIDLPALSQGDPALFSEFKIHFGQMGEKSFDHTKKYWFNKIRRQFPLAPEIKTEKVHIANPLAEQTITESLIEATPAPSAKLGFVPKFKMGTTPKPLNEDKKEESLNAPAVENKPAENAESKPAYVQKFEMKPKVEDSEEKTKSDGIPPPASGNSEAKPVYVPKFKMKPKVEVPEEKPEPENAPTPPENTETKPAYVPKFKMKPKVETPENEPEAENASAPENTETKPAYKPRFNMKNMPPKAKEE